MHFNNFSLHPDLLRGLDQAKYLECTEVQEKTLQTVLQDHRDVYAQSQTGTGKTAAFLVPTLQILVENQTAGQFALALVPTRELAIQVEKEASILGKFLSLRTACLYGGVGYDSQERSLQRKPQLIVATPGRLKDMVERHLLKLSQVCVLIIDEADRMFDMGFHKDVLALIKQMPAPKDRRNFLLSATLNASVGKLAWEHMDNPVDIVVNAKQVSLNAIEQSLYHVGRSEKMALLLALLQKNEPYNAIIFSNTKSGAGQIVKKLKEIGLECGLLEGDVPQNKRSRVINDMKIGKLRYLAATDVAARGLHVPKLDWVINFDLPNDAENYVHRIGRTARAGEMGKAISFACERYVYNLKPIEKTLGKKIPVVHMDDELKAMVKEIIAKSPAPTPSAHRELHAQQPHHNKPSRGGDRFQRQRPDRSPTPPDSQKTVREETDFRSHSSERREHPFSDGRRREHPFSDGRRREHPSSDGRRREHPSSDGRRREHPFSDGRRREHPSPDGRRREHPSSDGRRREHPSSDGRRREHPSTHKPNPTHQRFNNKDNPSAPSSRQKSEQWSKPKPKNPEDRMQYYKEKYGDNFVKKQGSRDFDNKNKGKRKGKPNQSFLNTVFGMIKGKK